MFSCTDLCCDIWRCADLCNVEMCGGEMCGDELCCHELRCLGLRCAVLLSGEVCELRCAELC